MASLIQSIPGFGGKSGDARGEAGDRVGVFSSVLCAIHCALTPFMFILLPSFGEIWAHPASHWLMALIVVPLAIWMVMKGYRKHGRRWILVTGAVGIFFVLIGAAAPYVEGVESYSQKITLWGSGGGQSGVIASDEEVVSEVKEEGSECGNCSENSCESLDDEEVVCERCTEDDGVVCAQGGCDSEGKEATESDECSSDECESDVVLVAGEGDTGQSGCEVDGCCPSVQRVEGGGMTLNIPLASILTTIGGAFLILTHIGNLRPCV